MSGSSILCIVAYCGVVDLMIQNVINNEKKMVIGFKKEKEQQNQSHKTIETFSKSNLFQMWSVLALHEFFQQRFCLKRTSAHGLSSICNSIQIHQKKSDAFNRLLFTTIF